MAFQFNPLTGQFDLVGLTFPDLASPPASTPLGSESLPFSNLFTPIVSAPSTTIDFTSQLVPIDGAAFTPVLAGAGAGSLSNGVYSYKFTLTDFDGGETPGGTATPNVTVVNAAANGKVTVSFPSQWFESHLSTLNIYRTVANGSTYKLVVSLPFNTNPATYLDNIADASLTTTIPSTNTTRHTNLSLVGDALVARASDFFGGRVLMFGLKGDDYAQITTPNADTGDATWLIFTSGAAMGNGNGGTFDMGGGAAYGTGHGGNATIFAGPNYGATGGNGGHVKLIAGDSLSGTLGAVQVLNASEDVVSYFTQLGTGVFTSSVSATDFIGGLWQGKTLTLSGNLITTGAFNPTFAIPSSSTWTFPSGGGTLSTTTGTVTSIATTSPISGGTITGTGTISLLVNTNFNWTAGQTITAPAGASALTLAGGTQTALFPALSLTQTWNNGSTTFTGALINITNTASNAASRYFDIQLAGNSEFYVGRQGLDVLGDTFMVSSAANAVSMYFSAKLGWNAAGTAFSAVDSFFMRGGAAATIQMGVNVNGAPTTQTFKAHNGITGTDIAGATLNLTSGIGTGAGTISTVTIGTPTVGSTGTTPQTITTRVTIDSSGLKATGYISSDGTAGATAGPFTTITSITVKNGLVTALTGA